jgi:hypothetical protein
LNKKKPCYKKIEEALCNVEDNVKDPVNVHDVTVIDPVNVHYVTEDPVNVRGLCSNLTENVSYNCSKCKRTFTRKDNMKIHEKKCNGFHKKQCKNCLRMFATPQAKWNHVQYVKCKM